jgi:hypothetical protein
MSATTTRNMEAKHTPGPWAWAWMRRCNDAIYLATPDRGQLIVMDFVRQGMQGGQPRFATWQGEERERMGGLMKDATDLDLSIHPDARLIAAAPDLLAMCKKTRDMLIQLSSWPGQEGSFAFELGQAIAKAEGT